jgi:glycosyltransferase involved in cell wall biosynthesis
MRILLINKFLFIKGGAEKHFFQLKQLLEEHGHDVALFGMEDSRNLPFTNPHALISHVDFEHVRFDWQGLRTAARLFYSFEARRKLRALIREFKPDIAHVHNIYHQISPSVLSELRRANVPVVYTVHDFHLLSPNYNLFANGTVDECVKPNHIWRVVRHRCVKHSFAASLLAAAAMAFHRAVNIVEKNVDVFIAPSNFLAGLLNAWGFQAQRVEVIPNFAASHAAPSSGGDSFLYIGRLSAEKGVATLVKAAAGLPAPVVIYANGAEEQSLKTLAAEVGATNVTFTPYEGEEKLQQLLLQARALIMPTVSYENSPIAVIEAMAAGVPVVASNLGGLPELVRDKETGRLFPAGDHEALSKILRELWESPEIARQLGQGARQFAERLTPEQYYRTLMSTYDSLVQKS